VRPWQRSSAGDPLAGGAGITVRNIDGHVAISGTVPSYPQYRQAAEVARRVAGVTSVHIHPEVVLPRVTTVTTPC
jgi:osmotically-inducible protein OsmY